MKSSKLSAYILLLAYLCIRTPVVANINPIMSPSDPILKSPIHDILVVKLKKMTNKEPYTNSNPPHGLFYVKECLRSAENAEVVSLFWSPKKTGGDFEPWTEAMPDDWRVKFYKRPLLADWVERPMEDPDADNMLIVFGLVQPEGSEVQPNYKVVRCIPYSHENKDIITSNITRADRAPKIQGSILMGLLGIGSLNAGLSFLFLYMRNKQGAIIRGEIMIILTTFMLCLYLVYEQGYRTGGIRIDLFLIYPLILVSILSSVFLGIHSLLSKNHTI